MISRRDALKLSAAGLVVPMSIRSNATAMQTPEPVGTPSVVSPLTDSGPSLSSPIALIWQFEIESKRVFHLRSDDAVIVGDENGVVYAIDAETGNERWRYSAGERLYSPVVADGLMFADVMSSIIAIDVATGREAWRFDVEEVVYSPRYQENTVYFGSSDGHLIAVDSSTGAEKWRFSTDDSIYSPTFHNNLLFAGSTVGGVFALDRSDGQLLWQFESDADFNSNRLVNGTLYVANADKTLFALDPETGEELWHFIANDNVYPPVPIGDLLFIRSSDYSIHALDSATGDEVWQQPSNIEISALIPSQNALFVGNAAGTLTALDPETGDEIWTFESTAGIYNPTIAGKVLYVGSDDGALHAIHTATGTQIWRFLANDWISSPILVGDTLIAASGDTYLYALANTKPVVLLQDVILRGAPSPIGVERGTAKQGEEVLSIGSSESSVGESWIQVNVAGTDGWIPASAIDQSDVELETFYRPTDGESAIVITYTASTIRLVLPTADDMPGPFEAQGDSPQTFQQAVDALGGTSEIQNMLTDAGWQAGMSREFITTNQGATGTTQIAVVVSAFRDQDAALLTLPHYASSLEGFGWNPVPAEQMGQGSAALGWTDPTTGDESVTMYVVVGQLLYRVFATGPEGADSLPNLLFMVEQIANNNL